MVEVYGVLFCGSRVAQSAGSSFFLLLATMASMSPASPRVTTSAGRPSMTERACLPDPPCDCLTVTTSPVFFFQ
jgi:hypothetical protein